MFEALRLALYRQVPWHRRPTVFSQLRRCGLIAPVPQQLSVDARPPAIDIAQLTARGREEIARLERERGTARWDAIRHADYADLEAPVTGVASR